MAPFASLDVAEQFLRVEFPNWFVYRGGSHVALHRVSGGARVLFVRDIAPADPLPNTNSTRHDRRAGTCTRCGKDFTECYSSASCDANLKAASNADFTVENHGSIFLLTPQNELAFAWADLHIDAQGQSIGQRTIAVEHRYIRDIVDGAIADGFTVR